MKCVLIAGIAVGLIVSGPILFGQSKPDFSGTWTLDEGKGSPAPRAARTLVITQSSNAITIETKRGDNSRTAVYRLDGSVNENPAPADADARLAKSTARWDGLALVMETETGDTRTKDVTTLDPAGEMIATMTIQVGSMKGRTFVNVYKRTGAQ